MSLCREYGIPSTPGTKLHVGALEGQARTKTSLQKAVCHVAETNWSGMGSDPAPSPQLHSHLTWTPGSGVSWPHCCPNVPANAHLAGSKVASGSLPALVGLRTPAVRIKASSTAIGLILSKPGRRGVSKYPEPSNLSPTGPEDAVIFHTRRTDKGAGEETLTCAIVSDTNIIGLSKSDSLKSVGTETMQLSCSRLTSSHSANCSSLAFCIDRSVADFKEYWRRTRSDWLVHQRIIMDIFSCVRDENLGKEGE